MKNLYCALILLGGALVIPSCSQYSALNTYKANDIGGTQEVKQGVVQSVTPVLINPENNNAGMALGAVAGGLGGSTLGKGTGSTLFTAGGAIAGAMIGSQADKAINQTEGLRINVKLNDGKTMSVVQPKSKGVHIYAGQYVQVYIGYKGSFVEPM